jgi:hypothetical protein
LLLCRIKMSVGLVKKLVNMARDLIVSATRYAETTRIEPVVVAGETVLLSSRSSSRKMRSNTIIKTEMSDKKSLKRDTLTTEWDCLTWDASKTEAAET